MNDTFFKGRWDEAKGEIRKLWGKLTGDEIDQTRGDVESIGGLLEQKYGMKKDEWRRQLSELRDRFAEDTKRDLRESNDNTFNRH